MSESPGELSLAPSSGSAALAELYADDRREHADVPPVGTPAYRALRERDHRRRERADELLASLTESGGRSHLVTLGKGYLVSRLQALLQGDQLHLPQTPQVDTLARELGEYEIRITEDANDRYGAFRVGTHDDLVNALGLAVQIDRVESQCSVFRVWERPGS